MPIFEYSGTNAEGQTERGMMPGASLDAVMSKLKAKGLQVTHVSLAQSGSDPLSEQPHNTGQRSRFQTDVLGPLLEQVPLSQLQFFFRQLAAMLSAGIGATQALETLSNQSQSSKLQQVLLETKGMVAVGQPISSGFERYPEVFSPMVISLVRAGEQGGFLVDQCKLISEYIQRDIELRNLIRKETLYPKVTLATSIIVILAARAIVHSYGKETHLTSPLTEPGTWLILGPVIIALFIYFKVIKKQPRMQYQWDAMVLRVPFIGNTSHGFAMAKFGRAFGALYKGGVPIRRAVELSADACGNEYVRSRMYPAGQALETGEGIGSAFARTGIVTPIALDMLRTGETTGNVDEMVLKMCEYYEEDGAVRARQAAVILGVAVLLLTGAYVLYVALQFYGGLANQYQDQM